MELFRPTCAVVCPSRFDKFEQDMLYGLASVVALALAFVAAGFIDGMEVRVDADFVCAHP